MEDIKINPDQLDVEWVRQPELTHEYNRLLAEARAETDRAKANMDLVEAGLRADIRSNPDDYKLDGRVTENAIHETVVENRKYRDALDAYNEAKRQQDLMLAAVKAMDAKKDALENLVRLFGQSYFAAPRIPHDLPQLVDQIRSAKTDRANKRIAGALNDKRRRT